MEALQEATKAYLAGLFKDTRLHVIHAKKSNHFAMRHAVDP